MVQDLKCFQQAFVAWNHAEPLFLKLACIIYGKTIALYCTTVCREENFAVIEIFLPTHGGNNLVLIFAPELFVLCNGFGIHACLYYHNRVQSYVKFFIYECTCVRFFLRRKGNHFWRHRGKCRKIVTTIYASAQPLNA